MSAWKAAAVAALISLSLVQTVPAAEPLKIGTRRELFVDDFLVGKLNGARRVLHKPVPREVVLKHDSPWEGSGTGYHSIFKDGDSYRMYYKAWQLSVQKGKVVQPHPLFSCYAESKDGIHWMKPRLGLFEFKGSKANNIVLASRKYGAANADAGHPAYFKDDNPNCAKDARYKAIIRSRGPKGLLAFKSADGLHWKPMSEKPVITYGAFDSQNLAFWDPAHNVYRAYWRYFTNGRRDILTATSKDFVNWSKPTPLKYPGAAKEHLYTNQIKPYHRAPHILIGFPTRYVDRGWSDSMRKLPELNHRKLRASASRRYGTAVTEGLLMSSRDGVTFHRWAEAFLPPGPQRKGQWKYGDNYMAWHIVETKSSLQGAPNELSLYASEGYWTGTSNQLRRYTLRLDGFVSIRAPMKGGTLITKPLIFKGNRLELNFASSAAGGIRVEMQDADGQAIDGFSLAECQAVFGDSVSRIVTWKKGADVGKLAGKTVRLKFELRDADLYSLQFTKSKAR